MAAGLLFGLTMALSVAPLRLWALGPVGLAGLAWFAACPANSGRRGRWRDLLLVAAGVLPAWLYLHWWLGSVAGPGMPGLALLLAGFVSLGTGLARRISTRVPALGMTWALPIAWTGVEMFRGEVFFDGYPWFLSAQPLIDSPWASSPGRFVGVYGVSFLVALAAGGAADAVRGARVRGVVGVVVSLLVMTLSWVTAPRSEQAVTLRVGAVQTNIPQSNKIAHEASQEYADFRRLLQLTMLANTEKPDVIVWPETMKQGLGLAPADVEVTRRAGIGARVKLADGSTKVVYDADYADQVLETQAVLGTPILVGEDAFTNLRFETDGDRLKLKYDARYNSVFLVRGGTLDPARYDKMRRTPFGETMPYIDAWPWLRDQLMALAAGGMKLDLSAGSTPTVFTVEGQGGGPVRVVTPICFEATVTGVCRALVYEGGQRRADVMINLTNDGWFGPSVAGRWHHLQVARWRCLELGTPMVRVANTGVSCLIDADGRLVEFGVTPVAGGESSGVGEAGVMCDGVRTFGVRTRVAGTVYGLWGNFVGWAALAATLGLCTLSMVPRRP